MDEKKGFFDGNPAMLFVFGLVTGVAVMALFGGGINLPGLGANNSGGVVDNFDDSTNPGDVANPDDSGAADLVLAPVTEDDHILGDIESAQIVLIEYSDFECPFCERHHPTMQKVMDNYGDDVAWVYRHFPLSFHEEAGPSAEASECAAEQGEFWAFADEMYARQDELGDDLYYEVAREIGLNFSQFEDCYESGKYAQDVASDLQSGAAAGVQGTPATFINGMLVSGAVPYETIVDAIDQVLEK